MTCAALAVSAYLVSCCKTYLRRAVTIQFLANPCIAYRNSPALNVEIEGCGHRPCRRLIGTRTAPKISFCCLLLSRFLVTSVTPVRYGGGVWESKLLGADSPSTYEEGPGRNWNNLASIGTANAALLPPHFSTNFSHGKNHLHDSTVSLPHRIRHCLSVNVHCCANVRMPQKFLLNFQVHVQCMEQGRV